MTEQQMRALRAGERLVIWAGKSSEAHGAVLGRRAHGIRIAWDDGETSDIAYADGRNVTLERNP